MKLTRYTAHFFFFNDPATTEIYTLSLHDALPISLLPAQPPCRTSRRGKGPASRHYARAGSAAAPAGIRSRSEEHTSELQSRLHLVCRLLLEKKKECRGSRNPTTAEPDG